MKKKEVLTEAQIDKAYEIVKGFNIADGEGEKRFEPGKRKPQIVFEKDFKPEVWKSLLKLDAVKLVEDVEVREDEVVIFEKIED
jgi:hypothetical protein